MKRLAPAVIAAALALLPRASWACAVCFSGTDAYREAFATTGIFLTLMPLIMVGGGALAVYRMNKNASQS